MDFEKGWNYISQFCTESLYLHKQQQGWMDGWAKKETKEKHGWNDGSINVECQTDNVCT